MSSNSIIQNISSASKRQWMWRIVSLAIAAVIIFFMLSLVDWATFWRRVQMLPLWSLVGAFVVYVLLNVFRAFRYQALLAHLRDTISIQDLVPIGLWHNFLVRLLPFKLGELTYIALMKQRLNVSVEAGTSSLFGSRLLELLVIVLIAAISLLASGSVLPNQTFLAMLLIVSVGVGGVLGLYASGAIVRGTVHFIRRLTTLPIVMTLCRKLDSLATEFDQLRQPGLFARALFWSCFTYACSFGVNAILLYGADINVSIPDLILLVSLGMFASAFPFNISGFGAVELSWAFGLSVLAGFSVPEATSIGLLLNGYQLLCAAVSGSAGWLVLQLTSPDV